MSAVMTLRRRFWNAFDRALSYLPGPPGSADDHRITPDPFERGISDEERLARHRLLRARYSRTGKGGGR